MLGMAIGEALGAPFEGLTHEQIQERAGRVEGFVDPRRVQSPARSGYFQLAVYEDETQMALAAADVSPSTETRSGASVARAATSGLRSARC